MRKGKNKFSENKKGRCAMKSFNRIGKFYSQKEIRNERWFGHWIQRK